MTHAGNIELVTSFYSEAFNDGEPEKAAARTLGDTYVQHNPGAPDGAAAFIGYVTYMRNRFPELRLEIRRAVSDGDIVVTHSHFRRTADDLGLAVADFWRIADGKIVEHWDVIQEVPADAQNDNTMF